MLEGTPGPGRVERAEPGPPRRGLWSWFPGAWVLRHYRPAWLKHDLFAGLALTAVLVPAGMGYAEAAGLPAVAGLYATVAPLLAYAIFGPSPVLVIGPDSALVALITAATLHQAANGDPSRVAALAALLAVCTGGLCVAAAAGRLGAITDLVSRPVRVGYLDGIALTVLVSQLAPLFGFSVKAEGLWQSLASFARGVLEGQARGEALAIGGGALAIIALSRWLWPKAPGSLVAVVLAGAAVAFFGLEGRLPVVGPLPRGLPLPSWPKAEVRDVGRLLVAAAGIALVAFTDTTVLSRALAGRGAHPDSNRELFGLGVANLAAGLFQGFPVSSSASRTPVALAAGSRTQLTGVVSALAVAALLLGSPGLVRYLPRTALAAVVIVASLAVMDVRSFAVFYRVRRSDLVLSMVAFFAVAALGVLRGIGVAVTLSLLDFVRRAWRPHDAVLGRSPGVKGYHDVERYPEARQVPGLLLFRWDAPLFFANASAFRARVLEAVERAEHPVRWVVLAAEPITDVDSTAAELLDALDGELLARGVKLAFAELKDPVADRLARYGLKKRIGSEFFFPTIGVAVKAFLEKHQVDWVDWEDARKE